MKSLITVTALLGLAGAASAQFTPIGPFTGESSENWTSVPFSCPPCFVPVIEGLFGGTAKIEANSAHLTGGWGFQCTIPARSSPRMFGSTGSDATMTFLGAPAGKFGAYMGTNTGFAGGTATFKDAGGAVIGVADLTLPADCTWNWNGWEFSTPVTQIVFHNNNPYGGGWCMLDDMEFSAFGGGGCYPDCDTSTGVGVLDIFDFLCFQNRFAASSAYACDCDTSTGSGVCDIFDFLCFQNEFSAGCP